LTALKAQWATFGALSDNELKAIGNAANPIAISNDYQYFLDNLDNISSWLKGTFDWTDPRGEQEEENIFD